MTYYSKGMYCKSLLLPIAALLVTGCSSTTQNIDSMPMPDYSKAPVESLSASGSIYEEGRGISLFQDWKARRVGDIVTVFLIEQTSGQNSSDTSLSQAQSTNISAPTFGGSTRNNMVIDLNSGRSFAGDSDSSQSNQLNGSITVTVKDVLSSGNLLVVGEKWIQINQSREHIELQGIIRTKDIGPDNSVLSTQVADARITYAGNGVNKDMNTMGWAARIVFSSLWPF